MPATASPSSSLLAKVRRKLVSVYNDNNSVTKRLRASNDGALCNRLQMLKYWSNPHFFAIYSDFSMSGNWNLKPIQFRS